MLLSDLASFVNYNDVSTGLGGRYRMFQEEDQYLIQQWISEAGNAPPEAIAI